MRNETSMHRLTCAFNFKDRKKNAELRKVVGLEPVSLSFRSRLRWFGHLERKNDADLVKWCMLTEIEGIRQKGRPKTYWDYVRGDMESLVCHVRILRIGITGD